jgi:predicted ATP-binding protein involved in virulence
MKIVKFEVAQLYGFLDLEIEFNDDLTIIVGRNGAGKTSALSLVSDLLRLDVPAVRRFPYNSVKLSLVDNELGEVLVSAYNSSNTRLIKLKIGDAEASLPLDLPGELYIQGLAVGRAGLVFPDLLNFSKISASLEPESAAIKITEWFHLSKIYADLTKLTFVRLDRTIVAIDPNGIERVEGPKGKVMRSTAVDPIDEVLRVTTKKFGEYKHKVEEIKSSAFDELLQLHFEPLAQLSSRAKSSQIQLRSKLAQLRKRVEKSAVFADSPTVQASTSRFFESFSELLFDDSNSGVTQKKRIGRKSLQEESVQILLNLKERQIERLLEIFEREQLKVQEAYGPIKRYLDVTSKFLRESGKRLDFDSSLQLGFSVPSSVSEIDSNGSKLRSLKELASGERQVIIVLTYLAFLAGEGSVFIVDEPELSLHLRWQGYLVDALRQLRPEGCQIIIATHAPEIAGRAKSKIKLLKPSYLPSDAE